MHIYMGSYNMHKAFASIIIVKKPMATLKIQNLVNIKVGDQNTM